MKADELPLESGSAPTGKFFPPLSLALEPNRFPSDWTEHFERPYAMQMKVDGRRLTRGSSPSAGPDVAT